ncbi:MAG: polyamine aminopropyltransferase [Armatimonadota bacterium]|nr:polyamine aminopropyltransferase [Armatimonadota bacterium]
MNQWLHDAGGAGFAHAYRIDQELYRGRSSFQEIRVIANSDFGRILVLDDAVQTTERDEFIYHEMLAHVPLLAHPAPRRLLSIGGGDGGLLEEALKHPLAEAVIVEIDREVVEVTRRFLPQIPGGAFDDPRTRLVIADGIGYVRESTETFDVILVDSTDPKGPAVGLFSQAFYADLRRRLRSGGLVAVQSGSPLYQLDLLRAVRAGLGKAFPLVCTYLATVPTYPGALWSFTVGTTGGDPAQTPAEEVTRRTAGFGLQYLTPAGFRAAFDLPPFLARELGMTA